MIRLEFAPRARADIDDIELYLTREAGRNRAKAMLKRIRDRVGLLAEFPEIGTVRDDYGGRRILPCRPYIIIYRLRRHGEVSVLIVLRIVHGARDIPTLLSGK
jgi:plasmid stabilization system protein ParE